LTVRRIDNATARRLFLQRHALAEAPSGPATGAALQALITRLGFVQLDSVNTLARAHDLILWSRRNSYRPESLRWLNDRARGTFEHWTHDAAKIPTAFFPYWRLKFTRDRDRLREKWNAWHGTAFHGELDKVMVHIRTHGAVCSADMAGARPEKSTGWWDWHPSKTALEYLWRCGDLAVTRRDGFRKVYDLTERVIPAEALNSWVSEEETINWACSAALDRLGFGTPGELARFWDLIRPAEAKAWVDTARQDGRVTDADIVGADGSARRAVMWTKDFDRLSDLSAAPSRLRLLSPFDPALRDRARAERLFRFHYRIEIFVPEAQRRFGYYVFPLLEGERLIGRIDVSANRQAGHLNVRALWPEPGVKWGRGRQDRLEAELHRLLRLACCDRVTFEPNWLRPPSVQA